MQTQSSGISRSIRGQITERNEVFYLQIERSDGSTLSLNSRDHAIGAQTVSSPITGRTVTTVPFLDWSRNSLTIAFGGVDYDPDNLEDWMAGGYWLHATGDWRNGQINGVEVGAIADGPEFPANTRNLPDSSTASYRGEAFGLYGAVYGTDGTVPQGTTEIGEYTGYFRARANFETLTVSGSITNINYASYFAYPDGTLYPASGLIDTTLTLENARIEADGNMTGNVIVNMPGVTTSSNGSWGSQLSSINDASGNPRAMGGTHGGSVTTSGGSETSFIGVHYGTTGRF